MPDETIAGTYDIVADTPIGRQRGTAVISCAGTGVRAEVDMGALGKDSMRGTCSGASFAARGERRQFPFGKVAYEISGSVAPGGKLTAELKSKVADISISGTRR